MQTKKWNCTQHKRSNYIAKLYSYSLKVISIILHIRGQREGTAASTRLLYFLIHMRMTSVVKYRYFRTNEIIWLRMFTVYFVPKFSTSPSWSNMKIRYHCNFLNRLLKKPYNYMKHFNCWSWSHCLVFIGRHFKFNCFISIIIC